MDRYLIITDQKERKNSNILKTIYYSLKRKENRIMAFKPGQSGCPEKKFTKENQPANRGRKKSKLSEFITESDIGADDINKVIKNVIFEKSQKELQALLEDVDQPMLIRVFIRAYLEDFKRGDLTRFETLANRAIGKPKEEVEHSVSEDAYLKLKELYK